MRYAAVICCLLASSAWAKDQQIRLEDIETDNLKSERRSSPKSPAASPTDYGFLPVRTASEYARQEPKQQYEQPQYVPQQYATVPQQYATVPQYAAAPQQYYYTQQQPQQYENVQYVTDNHIGSEQQQYYPSQQYVYVQPYPAPSSAVQTVVDPKVQYVMYVPTYPKAEQSQTYENYVPEKQFGSREPKSLLDSYVPSVLQVQYYNQARANSIQHSLKDAASVAGIKYATGESAIRYQVLPQHQH